MLIPALYATWRLLDAVREGGKEEDNLNYLMEQLSKKIKAQTQIVMDDLRESGKFGFGGRFGFYKKCTFRNSESVVVYDES